MNISEIKTGQKLQFNNGTIIEFIKYTKSYVFYKYETGRKKGEIERLRLNTFNSTLEFNQIKLIN